MNLSHTHTQTHVHTPRTCSIHLQTIANINFSQFWRVLIIPYGQSYSVEVYLSSKEFKLGSQILTFAVLHFSFFESVLEHWEQNLCFFLRLLWQNANIRTFYVPFLLVAVISYQSSPFYNYFLLYSEAHQCNLFVFLLNWFFVVLIVSLRHNLPSVKFMFFKCTVQMCLTDYMPVQTSL